jgi:hypothetical protein
MRLFADADALLRRLAARTTAPMRCRVRAALEDLLPDA